MDISQGGPLPIGQVMIELHLVDDMNVGFKRLHDWWERLESFGMRPVWMEVNLMAITLGKAKTDPRCVEVFPSSPTSNPDRADRRTSTSGSTPWIGRVSYSRNRRHLGVRTLTSLSLLETCNKQLTCRPLVLYTLGQRQKREKEKGKNERPVHTS